MKKKTLSSRPIFYISLNNHCVIDEFLNILILNTILLLFSGISIDGAPTSKQLSTGCSLSAQKPYIHSAPQTCDLSDVSAIKLNE